MNALTEERVVTFLAETVADMAAACAALTGELLFGHEPGSDEECPST